jgi:hypothetical protein
MQWIKIFKIDGDHCLSRNSITKHQNCILQIMAMTASCQVAWWVQVFYSHGWRKTSILTACSHITHGLYTHYIVRYCDMLSLANKIEEETTYTCFHINLKSHVWLYQSSPNLTSVTWMSCSTWGSFSSVWVMKWEQIMK